jgi:putative SOS response-associated peptidase YedK
MCTLYSLKTTQADLRGVFADTEGDAGNLHSLSAIFPDAFVPVIRNTKDGHELTRMRWGIPGPAIHGGGLVFNVRNTKSGFWKPLLKTDTRCLVPATSFCEYAENPNKKEKKKIPTWFALSDKRPLFFFAGVWKQWEGTRGTKAEPVKGKHLIYAFLTCEPNKVVAPVHVKAMPVLLTKKGEWNTWLHAPIEEALELQRPLPDKMLKIVASGEKKD